MSECCVCKKKLGFFDSETPIVISASTYVLCENCNRIRNQLKSADSCDKYLELEEHFRPLLNNPDTPYSVKAYFDGMREPLMANIEKEQKEQAERKAKEEAEKEILARQQNLLLTTGALFDGYHVVAYLDLICEEVVFKNSFMNRLSAGFEDFANSLTFQQTEMSGAGELIARARAYVKDKFCHRAAAMGANAVLGVEFESSVGVDVVRVAIFGTAVIVEKNDN